MTTTSTPQTADTYQALRDRLRTGTTYPTGLLQTDGSWLNRQLLGVRFTEHLLVPCDCAHRHPVLTTQWRLGISALSETAVVIQAHIIWTTPEHDGYSLTAQSTLTMGDNGEVTVETLGKRVWPDSEGAPDYLAYVAMWLQDKPSVVAQLITEAIAATPGLSPELLQQTCTYAMTSPADL